MRSLLSYLLVNADGNPGRQMNLVVGTQKLTGSGTRQQDLSRTAMVRGENFVLARMYIDHREAVRGTLDIDLFSG